MKDAIKTKKKEINEQKTKKREAREEAINKIEKYCEETFGGIDEELPSIQKEMEKFTKKINKTPIDNLSSVIEEAQKFIDNERNKIKRLY